MQMPNSSAILIRNDSITSWVIDIIIAVAWVTIAAKLSHRTTAV